MAVNCCYGDGNSCTPPSQTLYIHRRTVSIVSAELAATLLGEATLTPVRTEGFDLEQVIQDLALRRSSLVSELTIDDDDDYVYVECEPCKHLCKVRVDR